MGRKVLTQSQAEQMQAKVTAKKSKGGSVGSLGSTLGHKKVVTTTKVKKVAKKPRIEAKQLTWIKSELKRHGIEFVEEHCFAPPRKFRFDIAIHSKSVAIEYEGIMSSKSRHTSPTGYTNDCDKYNLAWLNGWGVIRLTALNYKSFMKYLKS